MEAAKSRCGDSLSVLPGNNCKLHNPSALAAGKGAGNAARIGQQTIELIILSRLLQEQNSERGIAQEMGWYRSSSLRGIATAAILLVLSEPRHR